MTIQELISSFARYRRRFNDIEITQMCGLGMGTNTLRVKTINPIVYFLYNQELTLLATDNITITPCSTQAENTFCYYLLSVNISGVVTTTKGIDNIYALPNTPAGNVAFGSFYILTDSGYTFTAGTTVFNATGITSVFYDIDTGIALQLINKAQKKLERGVVVTFKGSQRTIMDFQHMKVRVQITLNENDSTVILPFPNYKDFVDNGINITDSSGTTTPLEKDDALPIGLNPLTSRPLRIMRIPSIETVFTSDGAPAMMFQVWPTCDQTYTLDVQAYQYSPDLDGVIYQSNWLTDNASDVLLFGALVESGLYFGTDPQSKEWENRWNEAVWTLSASQSKEVYSGSYIYSRFPNPLNQMNVANIQNG
jgi:hypothetical protein